MRLSFVFFKDLLCLRSTVIKAEMVFLGTARKLDVIWNGSAVPSRISKGDLRFSLPLNLFGLKLPVLGVHDFEVEVAARVAREVEDHVPLVYLSIQLSLCRMFLQSGVRQVEGGEREIIRTFNNWIVSSI